ncbi:MAG: DNA-binding protein [Candidatus Omnitrophica bacterium]|nr:DNA-binding protein [Candidatus Omnitrophota bacterium]
MKQLVIRILSAGLLCVYLLSELTFAETLSSTQLINNAKEYDGQKVTYTGEVIGDTMARGAYAWININDGVNAIGVWASKDSIKEIIYRGSYESQGDIVETIGIFHRSCAEHGGDLDIHAERILKKNTGRILREPLDTRKINLAFLLAVLALGIWLLFRLIARLRR